MTSLSSERGRDECVLVYARVSQRHRLLIYHQTSESDLRREIPKTSKRCLDEVLSDDAPSRAPTPPTPSDPHSAPPSASTLAP